MMKTSKIALYIILLPVAVIVVASSLFLAFFDANDYKQDLVDYVKESSGRSLVFNGDAELMLYPNFGMKLGSMQFSNAPGFGSTPMFSVEEVSISVDVKSVLMLEPKVSQLILSELQIDLQKNKQGVTNWDDLVPEKAKQNNKKSDPETKTKEKESDSNFELAGAFEGININNAKISWRDATTGESFSIDDLDFTTGEITPTEPFPLSLQLKMQKQKDINAVIKLDAEVFFDQKQQVLSVQQLALNLTAHGDLIPVQQSEINLKANVKFDLDKQHLSMTPFMVTADIQGDSMPKGLLKAKIESEQFDFYLNQRKINLAVLKMQLNDIQFDGDMQVQDYAQPAVSFTLTSQKVDLDAFLGLADKDTNTSVKEVENEGTEEGEVALPMTLLRGLVIDGKLSINQLKAMNVKTTNNQLVISAKNGLVKIKPLALEMYDGSFNQQITLDVREEKPKYSMTTRLDKVQIGDLLIDFMQLDKIRGAATIALDVNTQGTLISDLKRNLNGDISLRFADGALKGFNLRHLVDSAKATLSGSKKPLETIQETDFTELTLSGIVKNGVFISDDLSLKSPLIRVTGEGQADLNKSELDYTVNAKIIGSLKGQTGAGIEAAGLLIPVRIFGPFAAPKTDILLDNMLRQQAADKLAKSKAIIKAKQQQLVEKSKSALEQKKQKLAAENKAKQTAEKVKVDAKKQAAKEKAKMELENKLKGLFN